MMCSGGEDESVEHVKMRCQAYRSEREAAMGSDEGREWIRGSGWSSEDRW